MTRLETLEAENARLREALRLVKQHSICPHYPEMCSNANCVSCIAESALSTPDAQPAEPEGSSNG